MGREIYCEIRKKGGGDTVWNSANDADLFVCGRDDATGYIASIADGEDNEIWVSSTDDMLKIIDNLTGYRESDFNEVRKAKETLSDLKCARRNTTNVKDFSGFSEMIEETEDWIKWNSYSRAAALVDMINRMNEEYCSDREKYKDCSMYIVVSE